MNTDKFHNIYFIGIGGIGMSALARYFKTLGKNIAGYDRVDTQLTKELKKEGMDIHFTDDIHKIPASFKNPDQTLVIYTPAIPKTHKELNYLQNNRFEVKKRSQILGAILMDKKGIAVAGTHGKTTVSSMIAYLLHTSQKDCSAFLGGIVKNFNSNFIVSKSSDLVVVEADEYDRSFLQLHPWLGIVTAMDPDHLDIYGGKNFMHDSFNQFVNQIVPGGILLHKYGLDLKLQNEQVKQYTYSLNNEKADFYALTISLHQGTYTFGVQTPESTVKNISLELKGLVNVENAVAAVAAATLAGVPATEIEKNFRGFEGIRRRFDYQINTDQLVFIDDYAHHPKELEAIIKSVRALYPGRHITGIFQPHLYSRTRDFADGFAESLSLLDDLILLDIYPARELPIPGVTSQLILNKVSLEHKKLIAKTDLVEEIKERKQLNILLTLGAGDIDKEVEPIRNILLQQHEQ
ncbi:MAG: UDP-N-acetylmuramate--L-alanine ligase [Bacteroidetes bacterium]|nr:UDP-N-acetylmuramate--L-alanine ligase [Bacteroidota bacterium]